LTKDSAHSDSRKIRKQKNQKEPIMGIKYSGRIGSTFRLQRETFHRRAEGLKWIRGPSRAGISRQRKNKLAEQSNRRKNPETIGGRAAVLLGGGGRKTVAHCNATKGRGVTS